MTRNTLALHYVVQYHSYKENTVSPITILCSGVRVIETEQQQNYSCHSERLGNNRRRRFTTKCCSCILTGSTESFFDGHDKRYFLSLISRPLCTDTPTTLHKNYILKKCVHVVVWLVFPGVVNGTFSAWPPLTPEHWQEVRNQLRFHAESSRER